MLYIGRPASQSSRAGGTEEGAGTGRCYMLYSYIGRPASRACRAGGAEDGAVTGTVGATCYT